MIYINEFTRYCGKHDLLCSHFYAEVSVNFYHYNSHVDKLPYSVRVLLESATRNCDNFHVKEDDVMKILDWEKNQSNSTEVPFKPSRVILQDFT